MIATFLHLSFAVCTFAVIINEYVDRKVDLTTQIVKTKESIVFKNAYRSNISTYSYLLEYPLNGHIDFYQDERKLEHESSFMSYNNKTYKEFLIKLLHPIKAYENATIIAVFFQLDKLKLLNKKRKVDESQIYQYIGNLFFFSKYVSKNFKCVIDIKNPVVEVSEKFHRKDDDVIIYKAIEMKPYSTKNFELIFENNEPFYVINNLERTIFISHYGRILVEDKINITNTGSSVDGPFDSFKAKRRWFHTFLPASSENIKFFDILGYSSKTDITTYKDYKKLSFQLRYPLLGGWKSNYILQYTLPTYEYLRSNRKGKYRLKMRIMDHVMNDAIIKDATIKIILPEGVGVVKINYPEQFYKERQDLSFTSLSFSGRPTIVFSGEDLTDYHIISFTITYTDLWLNYYRIPLILVAYLQILFLLIILFRYYKY